MSNKAKTRRAWTPWNPRSFHGSYQNLCETRASSARHRRGRAPPRALADWLDHPRALRRVGTPLLGFVIVERSAVVIAQRAVPSTVFRRARGGSSIGARAQDAVTHFSNDAARSRRHFLALMGLGTVASLGGSATLTGCSKRARAGGAASNAGQVAAILPNYEPLSFVPPDIPGEGAIPDGYQRYPRNLVRAIREKPGRGGPTITTMTPWWGPTPPGLGRTRTSTRSTPSSASRSTRACRTATPTPTSSAPSSARATCRTCCRAPTWEIDKIPRFSQAVKALFEDLTRTSEGDAVARVPDARDACRRPPGSTRCGAAGSRRSRIPTDGPFPWALFYRKDLTRQGRRRRAEDDRRALRVRKEDDRTRPRASGRSATSSTWCRCSSSARAPRAAGARSPAAGSSTSTRLPSTGRRSSSRRDCYKEGLVHPDVIASNGADSKQLFNGARCS